MSIFFLKKIRLTCFLLVALWGAPDPAIEAALEALQEAEDGARAPTDASGSPTLEAKRRYTTGTVVPTVATSMTLSKLSVRTHVVGKDNGGGDGDDDDSHDKYHALMT